MQIINSGEEIDHIPFTDIKKQQVIFGNCT